MGNEGIGYSGFSSTVAANSDQGFVVFDTRIRDYIGAHEPEFVELIESGGVREARSTVDIAAFIGCPSDAVTSTLESYNAAAENRRSDEFGRTAFGIAPLQPPYCVVRSVPALFHTQGGVDVDARAQVRRRDGSVIPGLFAGGGVTAGLSGTAGAEGYSSGNGLLSAVGLGRIAGHSAAAAAKSARVG
jgi:fumarate reductase flavoprotein subunit